MRVKLRLEYKDTAWWYWLVTWVFIAAGLCGWERGFYLAAALAAFQILHFAVKEKSFVTLPVQVRVTAFLLFMIAGIENFRFLFWLPAVGLAARVTVNYCLIARTLSLMPWNLRQPFSIALVRKRIFSLPVEGSILDHS